MYVTKEASHNWLQLKKTYNKKLRENCHGEKQHFHANNFTQNKSVTNVNYILFFHRTKKKWKYNENFAQPFFTVCCFAVEYPFDYIGIVFYIIKGV